MEGILEALALVIVIFKGGETAIEEVLIVRVKRGADSWCVFGLGHIFGLKSIPEVGIVSGSPLILPAHVVGVTIGVAKAEFGSF